MAQLWTQDARSPDDPGPARWVAQPLDRAVFRLVDGQLLHTFGGGGPFLIRGHATGEEIWLLLGSAAIRINGVPLQIGVRVLRDRDEIVVGPHRVFFSTERLPSIEPCPASADEIHCPRCKQLIAPGSPAVRCPRCGVWHHESRESELPCWSYAERCTLCDQPTSLAGTFGWTPEEL